MPVLESCQNRVHRGVRGMLSFGRSGIPVYAGTQPLPRLIYRGLGGMADFEWQERAAYTVIQDLPKPQKPLNPNPTPSHSFLASAGLRSPGVPPQDRICFVQYPFVVH